MKRIATIASLCLTSALLQVVAAQDVRGKDLMTDLTRSMDEARRKIPNMVVSNDLIRGTDPIAFLEILDTYLEEDSEEVRREAYWNMSRTGMIHTTPNVRRAVTDRLVAGFEDPSPHVRDIINRRLGGFLARDFTPQAKQKLRQLAHATSPPNTIYLHYLGVAGITEEIPFIESLLGPTQEIYRAGVFNVRGSAAELEWDALLVLARLGDDRAAQRAVEIVDSEERMKDKLQEARAFLAYTRHPIAVDYIVQMLLSNATIPIRTGEHIPAARGAARILSLMLDNFPNISEYADRTGTYRGDDLEAVRAWARQQTTWVLKK